MGKGTLGHRLESEPGRPCVIITISSAKYVSEGNCQIPGTKPSREKIASEAGTNHYTCRLFSDLFSSTEVFKSTENMSSINFLNIIQLRALFNELC